MGEENNGTTIAAMNLIRFLKSRGHTVRILCADQDKKGEDGVYVVPNMHFGKALDTYVAKVGVTIAKADEKIVREALAGVDHVHTMLPFSLGMKIVQIAKEMGLPVTAGFHMQAQNFTSYIKLNKLEWLNTGVYRFIYRHTYRHVDAIHYPTAFIQNVFEENVKHKTNGYVISNGVHAYVEKRDTPKPPELQDKIVILSTGRYSREKSQDTLIKAVALSKHRDKIQLILGGQGVKEAYYRKLAKKLPVAPIFKFYPSKLLLRCPHCSHALDQKKERKHFVIHKCINPKCPYYLNNLKKVDKKDLDEDYGKNKYKLHYIYREFVIDFFKFDITTLPTNASSLKFTKHNAQVMSLCLTYKVNLGLSLRKTSQALKDIHGISISHQMVANYCKTAALCVKPFVDSYPYEKSNTFTADETYIKVRGIKGFIWFIMDAMSRVIIGYQISDNRGVGPCIMAMRMAFQHLKELPKKFRFIADAYSAYPLAAQQFFRKYGDKFKFDITQVVGLTNDDAVSTEYRPYKQMIERLNRTYKASYRPTNGFDNYEGASYDLALWVAYYNFLRPHKIHNYKRPLVENDIISNGSNMQGKWQLLIFLGQQTILEMQRKQSA